MTSRRKAAQWLLGGGLMAGSAAAARAQNTPVAPVPGASGAAEAPLIDGRGARVPRLGLALGGGSARGFAHIGVLKSLDQAGIRPEVVVGTSAGALVGAFYAAGFSSWKIEEVALRTREVDLADLAQGSKRGMLVGDSLSRFVNDALRGARIEDLRTRYGAVATDLRSGELVLLRSGAVADAVRASCSIPGVFVPRELGGRELVDGGLVSPLPVRAARQLGCDVVIAVDVGTRPNRATLPGMYEVLLQSFEIMGRALSEQEAMGAEIVLRPDTSAFASTDFNARRDLIQAGYEAAQRALPELRRRLSAPATRPRRG
jgi:NTE family protein